MLNHVQQIEVLRSPDKHSDTVEEEVEGHTGAREVIFHLLDDDLQRAGYRLQQVLMRWAALTSENLASEASIRVKTPCEQIKYRAPARRAARPAPGCSYSAGAESPRSSTPPGS